MTEKEAGDNTSFLHNSAAVVAVVTTRTNVAVVNTD